MRTFIVVSGIPASGKTTLARVLARDLMLPLWDKDDILESLFERQPPADAQARSALSRQADQLLISKALETSACVLVSWWKHPESNRDSGTPVNWLNGCGARTIEVRVLCEPEVAATRFLQRQRHPGHMDHRWTEADLMQMFVNQQALGALGIGPCIFYAPLMGGAYGDLLAQLLPALE